MDRYGLIGHPLGHSFSRQYFAEKFQSLGIEAEYQNFDLAEIAEVKDVVREHQDLKGFNVTIPYKQQIIPYLASLSDEAAEIGAVNTVRVVRNAEGVRLEGYNTDIIGFTESIRPMLKEWHRHALVLGTGGASKAVVVGLKRLGIEVLQVSRTPREGMIGYENITHETLHIYNVVVNCTPVGMFPHVDESPLLPYEAMNSETVAFDLVYNPLETQFLQRAKAAGAAVQNGLQMLHLQAEAAWKIWNFE